LGRSESALYKCCCCFFWWPSSSFYQEHWRHSTNRHRQLTSKCANAFGIKKLAPYFYPHQLGVGTAGGCEAAVHSARRYIEAVPRDHVLVKLDFTNAFNGVYVDGMLHSVYNRIPELYAFCKSAYGQSSVLHLETYASLSEEGTRQGDPRGPLLFCNTIHPTLSSLQAQLN